MTSSGPRLLSVNLAVVRDNPFKDAARTGIDKRPVDVPVEVRAPGSKEHGLGGGLVGDFIGDRRNHGGDDQSVYAYALEDLQWWADELGATLAAGQSRGGDARQQSLASGVQGLVDWQAQRPYGQGPQDGELS